MTKRILYTLLIFAVASLAATCSRWQGTRYLIVSEVAHFEIQGGTKDLGFPTFASGATVEEIEHDVSLADYYYNKLSSIYDFKYFKFIGTATSEYLLARSGDLRKPARVYGYEDSLTHVELLLVAFDRNAAQYAFRLTDRRTGQTREHIATVPAGKSASIGTLLDKENGRGYLVSVALKSLAVTPTLTPQQLADFLKQKNTPRDTDPAFFKPGDQKWMDELFGRGKMQLPVRAPEDLQDSNGQIVPVDQYPYPLGGMQSIGFRVVYPQSALADGLEGKVLVAARIDESGKMTACRVVKSVRADLDSAAVRAVEGVLFTPARYRDKPLAVWVTIPINFKLG